MASNLQNPIFTDETKAREWLEARVWPNGPHCPHCGNADQDKITGLHGKAHRPGLYQCNEPECREQFTVTVGTVFERSKIPLSKWMAALFLLTASKKGVSAHQIHRSLNISYKSSWFMMHRLREALRTGGLEPLGGEGRIVEADETYYGSIDKAKVRTKTTRGRPFTKKGRTGPANKRPILSLVERGGRVRSFHVPTADKETVDRIVKENVARESKLHTDESRLYGDAAEHFAEHETVKHTADEYVRIKFTWGKDGPKTEKIHTNSAEGYFSIFKRGMKGVYQHCKEKHLHRYLAEFDFRYNNREALGVNDLMRAELAAKGIIGKRLTYRRPHEA
jgi:transposase-like protein